QGKASFRRSFAKRFAEWLPSRRGAADFVLFASASQDDQRFGSTARSWFSVMPVTHAIESIGATTIDLPRLEAHARQQACVEAILGNIPIGDFHECMQRIMAEEIQRHMDPECTTCDPRGEERERW